MILIHAWLSMLSHKKVYIHIYIYTYISATLWKDLSPYVRHYSIFQVFSSIWNTKIHEQICFRGSPCAVGTILARTRTHILYHFYILYMCIYHILIVVRWCWSYWRYKLGLKLGYPKKWLISQNFLHWTLLWLLWIIMKLFILGYTSCDIYIYIYYICTNKIKQIHTHTSIARKIICSFSCHAQIGVVAHM